MPVTGPLPVLLAVTILNALAIGAGLSAALASVVLIGRALTRRA